jgi:acetolactate synthase-1/2/3 large subunit
MTGGQALVQSLKTEGVRTIFGLPGVQLDWAFDALYAERETIRVVHTRHEQAAAYMADGYARTTGDVGVFLVVPGPGVLNTASALATAYANNSPVLCVTGQVPSDLIGIGRGVLHEIDDQLGLLRHLMKWAARASTPGDVPYVVHEVFRQLWLLPKPGLYSLFSITTPSARPGPRASARSRWPPGHPWPEGAPDRRR